MGKATASTLYKTILYSGGARKYFWNTSWMFVDRVVRTGVVLLTSIYVARYLGDQLLGQLNYASGFVGLFGALTAMGLNEIVMRDLVKHPERRDELLGTAALLKLCGASLLLVLATAGSLVKDMGALTVAMVVIIAAAELFKPLMVIDFYFTANVKAKKSAQVGIVQTWLSAGFKLALIFMEAPLIWFAWASVVDMAVMSLGYLIAYHRDGMALRAWRYSRNMAKHLLRQSWPLLIYGLALLIQARIDQVMIFDLLKNTVGEAQANAEVGQYSVALKMIDALGFLSVMIQQSVAPAITGAKVRNKALYEDRLVNQYRLMFLIFLITSVPLYFLAEPLIVLLYGEEFRPAGYLLSLFAIRLFFTNMGVAKTSFITNESLFKYALTTAVVGATLNITMNYFLIPEFKSVGAIWATIGSFLVSIFLMDLLFKKTRANFKWMLLGIATFWKLYRVN